MTTPGSEDEVVVWDVRIRTTGVVERDIIGVPGGCG